LPRCPALERWELHFCPKTISPLRCKEHGERNFIRIPERGILIKPYPVKKYILILPEGLDV
jgi:hypothetical protein